MSTTGMMTLLACAAALLAGCDGRPGGDGDDPDAVAVGAATGRDTLSDRHIAALVTLINGTEIAAARAVQPKLGSAELRAYATTLIQDHTRLRQAMPALEPPRTAPPQANTMRAIFHSQSGMMATLPAGLAFDATFAAIQTADHAMAIDSLRHWHGMARSQELRDAIASALPVMQSHLERAQAIYQRLDRLADLGQPGPADTTRASMPGPAIVPADTAPEGGAHEHGAGAPHSSPTTHADSAQGR